MDAKEKVTLIIGNVPQSMVVAMMQAAQQAGLDLSLWLRLVVEAELKRGQITGLYGVEPKRQKDLSREDKGL